MDTAKQARVREKEDSTKHLLLTKMSSLKPVNQRISPIPPLQFSQQARPSLKVPKIVHCLKQFGMLRRVGASFAHISPLLLRGRFQQVPYLDIRLTDSAWLRQHSILEIRLHRFRGAQRWMGGGSVLVAVSLTQLKSKQKTYPVTIVRQHDTILEPPTGVDSRH